jgi:HEAT repeat protein
MNSRRRILAVSILVAIAGIVFITRPREPTHDGKPLSEWLRVLEKERSKEERTRAEEAVRAIGSKAIPALLRLIKAKDSYLKQRVAIAMRKQEMLDFEILDEQGSQGRAYCGFRALGSNAISAAPALARLLSDKDARYAVAPSLAVIGAEGMNHLAKALTDADPEVREIALYHLTAIGVAYRNTNQTDYDPVFRAGFGPSVEAAVFPLVICAKDPTYSLRSNVVTSLGRIGQKPEMVVPALIEILNDEHTSPDVSGAAIRALGRFRNTAQSARPAIQRFLAHSDGGIRRAASNALAEIR